MTTPRCCSVSSRHTASVVTFTTGSPPTCLTELSLFVAMVQLRDRHGFCVEFRKDRSLGRSFFSSTLLTCCSSSSVTVSVRICFRRHPDLRFLSSRRYSTAPEPFIWLYQLCRRLDALQQTAAQHSKDGGPLVFVSTSAASNSIGGSLSWY